MQDEFVLTLNAGSSSLKFALFARGERPRRVLAGSIEGVGAQGLRALSALDDVMKRLEPYGGTARATAVGHRVVHGGARFEESCLVTAEVLAELRRLSPIDPNHLPAQLAIMEAMRVRAGDLRQVACFDTAFHRTLPRVARLVPIALRYEGLGVQRYGFHGLSYTYLLEELTRVAGDAAARGRVVMAHLGSGASLVAVREGRAVETTMGFTPTSGIPMGTRSGDVDPGVLLFLLRTQALSVDALDELLNHQSGLRGLSETTSDVRELLVRESTDARAADALAVFCHRARQAVGALAATIGGLDTLVFSGGIGEHAPPIRARIAGGLEHLGVRLDSTRNDAGRAVVSADGSPCTVRVLPTDEESIIARETLRVLEESRS